MAKPSKAQQRKFINTADEHQQHIVKALRALSLRHSVAKVWADWVEMSAIAMSNAVDKRQFEPREKRYLQIVGQYQPDEVQQLAQALAHLVACWELRVQTGDFGDVLGATFMMLDMGNESAGQFFTPYEVSRLMGQMLGVGKELQERAKAQELVQLMEPACGAGGMIIASAQAMREAGLNYQQQLHVSAIDIDARCVHMTYLQLSLLHIPAVIVHGDALSGKEWGHWYTPAHVLGGWESRLRRHEAIQAAREIMRGTSLGEVVAESDAVAAQSEPQDSAQIKESLALPSSAKRAAQAAAAAGQMLLF